MDEDSSTVQDPPSPSDRRSGPKAKQSGAPPVDPGRGALRTLR